MRVGVQTLRLVVLAAGILLAGPAPAQEEDEAVPGRVALPSVETLLAHMEQQYNEYGAVASTLFKVDVGDRDFDVLEAAVNQVAIDALQGVATDQPGAMRLLECLQEMADNKVLLWSLAAVSGGNATPAFVREYIKSWCAAALGNPYTGGKIQFRQAAVSKPVGDVVVDKSSLWLTQDLGFAGNRNGTVEAGESFSFKIGLSNHSRKTAYLSATARLAVLDAKLNECLPPGPEQTPAAECAQAFVTLDRQELPELSPGEKGTVGPFDVVLSPSSPPGPVRLLLVIQSSEGKDSSAVITVTPAAVPDLTVADVAVDDDGTGSSQGNGNRRIEPGEKVELRPTLALSGKQGLWKVEVAARNYSSLLRMENRTFGMAALAPGKPVGLGRDFEFTVPPVEQMAAAMQRGEEPRFMASRQLTVWLVVSGCAGKGKADKGWEAAVPASYLCPAGTAGYRYVLPVTLPIKFGQVLLITTDPPAATVAVNGEELGVTEENRPVIFAGVQPRPNEIVYYTVSATRPGFLAASVQVPVIEKNEGAGNLTTTVHLELEAEPVPETVPLVLPPPVPPPVPDPLPQPRVKTVVRTDPSAPGSLAVFAAPVVRYFQPQFDRESAQLIDDYTPTLGGLTAGVEWFLGRGLYLSLDGQYLFLARDPALKFTSEGTIPNENGSTTLLPAVIATVDSLALFSLDAGPGFRVAAGPLFLSAAASLHVESLSADDPQPNTPGTKLLSGLETFQIGARLALFAGVDTGSAWSPFLGFNTYLPREGPDWGLCAGVEFRP